MGPREVVVLNPHGFCAGVTGALRKADSLLAAGERGGNAAVYCLHELVHNELVVESLRSRGMVFVESLSDVPAGAKILISAHGTSPAVRRQAEAARLELTDATCPFVTRVHAAARGFAERGLPVVVIGRGNHAEVRGILGEVDGKASVISNAGDIPSLPVPAGARIGVVSQTTMNADEVAEIVAELSRKYPVETAAEVCRATKERQDAVRNFEGDAVLVLGSANSSNTRRLCEVARSRKKFRAATMDEVRALDFSGVAILGVTSGASTPENFFNEVVSFLKGECP